MNLSLKTSEAIDYGLFSFRACIDWIEIKIETQRATHGHHIWETLKLPGYAKPTNPGAANEATQFRLIYQDLEKWQDLSDFLSKLEKHFPLASPPVISGVEIAFDAFSKGASEAQLQIMSVKLLKLATEFVSDNIRFSGKTKGGAEGLLSAEQILRKIQDDRVINIGNKGDDKSQRIYFKKKDGNRNLPPQKYRARREITLRGDAVPFKSLEEARIFNFTVLSRYFKFRQIKESDYPIVNFLAERASIIGARVKRTTNDNSYRMYDSWTKADTRLNRIAYDSLRGLNQSLRKTSSRGRKPIHKKPVTEAEQVHFAG